MINNLRHGNIELQAKLKSYESYIELNKYGYFELLEEKLNTAKQIISNLLSLPYGYCNVLTDKMKGYITEAEEFLDETEN